MSEERLVRQQGLVEAQHEDVAWRLKLQSSEPFEKIMGFYENKIQEKIRKKASEQSTKEADITEEVTLLALEDDIEEIEEAEEDSHKNPVRVKARRAWTLIRRHIREQAMNKKQSKSNFQWNMLSQTLKNMTNMDAARGNLYNKYLNPSNPRSWADGIKSIPHDFFARHSKHITRTANTRTSRTVKL